jgi:hypothetical protein
MSEKKVIGIRGLDEKIYDEIQKYAKETNQNIAEIFNQALEQFLKTQQNYNPPQVVSGHSKFIVNVEALQHLSPLRVENVERVIIDNDEKLTLELIEKNLEGIKNAEAIYVPQRLYYLIIKKSKHCDKIEPYEGVYRVEETLEFNSTVKLTKNMLERFQQQNKRVKIRAYGDLWIDYYVPVELFDDVVTRINAAAGFYCSEELQPIALTKAVVTGNLGIIDENNNPIEIQQVSSGRGDRRTRRHGPHAPPEAPFIDLSAIADAVKEIKRSLTDFGPQFSEKIAEAFKNIEITEESVDFSPSKKKRTRYQPKKSADGGETKKDPLEEGKAEIKIKFETDEDKQRSAAKEDEDDTFNNEYDSNNDI